MGPWVSSCYGATCEYSSGATRLRTVYRHWIWIMKANVTGYQPYLQQAENTARGHRNVIVTAHNYNYRH
jgi:hypothetical protein